MEELYPQILADGIEYRILHLTGEITPRVSTMFVELLNEFEIDPEDEKKPATVFINSPGGSLPDAMVIADAILTVEYPVLTVGAGIVFSGAFLVLLAGDVRMAYKHTKFMFHNFASTFDMGKAWDMKNFVDACDGWSKELQDYIRERTNIPKDIMEKIFDRDQDVYFSAEEAIKYNIINDIVSKEEVDVARRAKKNKVIRRGKK